MARMEVKDSRCLEPGIALDFNVSDAGPESVSDKRSLEMTDINEPKLPFRGLVEL